MQIIHTISELKALIASYKQDARTIAFVPTMGNLHEGHLQLVSMAKNKADIVICSIFVNPLQFGVGEDFDKYPKTLQADTARLQPLGCDIVFAPSVDEMYPADFSGAQEQTAQSQIVAQSQIIVPWISDILEGKSRPGHFTGVATIVGKLFNIVQPDTAVFGEKDYQQLIVIKRFVKDLCFPVNIQSHPIVREKNGLAMSSRNGYLTEQQKQQAALIYQQLKNIARKLIAGNTDYVQLEQTASETLNHHGFRTDYIKICHPDLSEPAISKTSRQLVILAAAYLGSTRLIDNLSVELKQ